jgi:hypothetical protein
MNDNTLTGPARASAADLFGRPVTPERTAEQRRAFADEIWRNTEHAILQRSIGRMVPGCYVRVPTPGAPRVVHQVLASYIDRLDPAESMLEIAVWDRSGQRGERVISVRDVDDIVPTHLDPTSLYRRVEGASRLVDLDAPSACAFPSDPR